jgi:EAL and modified HD-GYP domain-containing signal transduction protein
MGEAISSPGEGMGISPSDGLFTETLHYVARQPILNLRGEVHGYELLFRSGMTSGFSGDGDQATRSVLDNTLVLGLEKLTHGLPAFVNCTREALLDGLVAVLPPRQSVLEILETLEPTESLLRACVELKSQGFRIALDDFVWHRDWEPFLKIADYVKVEFFPGGSEGRIKLIDKVRRFSPKMLIERVETQEDVRQARREGFTLFQGFYFCRPELLKNPAIAPNRLIQLQLLQALQDRQLDTQRITSLVKRDASLTFRLLKLANSAIYATSQQIRSIQTALVAIGDDMFRRMATVAIASELAGSQTMELMRMAFVRGRFCELVAPLTGRDATEQYLLGIFSLVAAMMRLPMESIVASLALREEIRMALLGAHSDERAILTWLEWYELGKWDLCDEVADAYQLPEVAMTRLYGEATQWAEETLLPQG